jgi:glycosyltransferase involved in cell wall biosynthesis
MKGVYGFLNRMLLRFLYRRAGKIIAVSRGVKDELIKILKVPAEKIMVIYNPVDICAINGQASDEVEHPWFNDPKVPLIISMGRLTKQKNQKDLLQMIARFKEEGIHCRLVIIGEGELRPKLQELAAKLGIEDDFLLLGQQENPFKYLIRATIFVFPSLFEGFPNALLEAMALGCPVVASDCISGPRELLTKQLKETHSYGMLFKAGDIDEMSSCVRKMITDKDLRDKYGVMAKERAADFNTADIVSCYESAAKVLVGR